MINLCISFCGSWRHCVSNMRDCIIKNIYASLRFLRVLERNKDGNGNKHNIRVQHSKSYSNQAKRINNKYGSSTQINTEYTVII